MLSIGLAAVGRGCLLSPAEAGADKVAGVLDDGELQDRVDQCNAIKNGYSTRDENGSMCRINKMVTCRTFFIIWPTDRSGRITWRRGAQSEVIRAI